MDSSAVAPMTTDKNNNLIIIPNKEDHNNQHHYNNNKNVNIKPSKGGWNAALFIIFVEVADRFAYYGLAGNLMMYLTKVLQQPTATAAKNVNMWTGVSALFPLLGGLLADSFFGRFKTIILASAVYIAGMVAVTLSVSNVVPEHHQKVVFFVAIYVLAVGEGGHKPCVQTFAADQFDEALPEEKKAKSSFFNWWYMGIVAGSTAAIFVVIYIQDNISWTLGYGVLAAVLAVALALFLVGIKTYRKQVPVGSPLTTIAQVLVAAARKWRVDDTAQPLGSTYDHGRVVLGPVVESQPGDSHLTFTNKFRFLNKAAITDARDTSKNSTIINPWRLCSIKKVEQVKLILRLIPIWLTCLMFNVVQSQLHTFFTKQSSTMVRTVGARGFTVPPASLQGLVGLTILATVTLYDRVLVPLARKRTGHPSGITVLQRIGFGLFLSVLTMAVAALVEARRLHVAARHGLLDDPRAVVPIRVWWLLPQYMICGLSDAFEVVGLQELFYAEMPEEMRSLGAAAHISIVGAGSFVSSWIISLVEFVTSKSDGEKWLGNNLNRSHLDRFYWVLAGLSAINLCVYVWVAKGFVYKESHDVEGLRDGSNKVAKDGFGDGQV